MGVKLIGDVSGVMRQFEKIDKEDSAAFLREIVEETYQEARERAGKHSQTGRMERNLSKRVSGMIGEVFVANNGMMQSGINYAIFVHFGTKPHIITPKNKKALRWPTSGGFAFSKRVHHPGYRGDPFLYDALDAVNSRAETIFNNFMKDFE